MPTPLLLLFDLDGTLLAGATKAHREALHEALREVHCIEVPETLPAGVNPAGRTDSEIARLILVLAGVPAKEIDDRRDAVREVCCREFARRCPNDLSHRVIPGIRELLLSLFSDDGVRTALLTGNFEPIARMKLKRAGIGQYFPVGQGAFGTDAEDRAELPGIARRRAGQDDVPHPRGDTVVIGDTPLDIACAHADGVRCVAVATGPFTVEELSDADLVAADVGELADALSALAR